MGEIIRANACEVYPYQRYVRFDSLGKLLPFFKEGRQDEIFPCFVGKFPSGLVAIDGHQRLTLADLFGCKFNLYVMDHREDLMQRSLFSQYDLDFLIKANMIAAFTYENASIRARNLEESRDKLTFSQLRLQNGIIDIESLERLIDKYGNREEAGVEDDTR